MSNDPHQTELPGGVAHGPIAGPPAGTRSGAGPQSRRSLLRRAGAGLGMLALGDLLSTPLSADEPGDPLAAHPGHFPAKAKSIIWLFMNGGPSHIDTWDYKPALEKHDGQELAGFDKSTGFFTDQVGPLMRSPFAFSQHGQCGAYVSRNSSPRWPAGRPHGLPQELLDRLQQPRPGAAQDQFRHDAHGLPEPGRLAHLRHRLAKPRSAGLRGHDRHQGRGLPKGNAVELERRLPAQHLPRHSAQAAGIPDRGSRRACPISPTPNSAPSSA
jgi:hypothetical protein